MKKFPQWWHNQLMPQKGFAILPLVIVFALIIGGAYFLISKGIVKNPLQSSSSGSNLGSQIFEKTQNPVNKLPETNPFAKVNPFKGVYKNPF